MSQGQFVSGVPQPSEKTCCLQTTKGRKAPQPLAPSPNFSDEKHPIPYIQKLLTCGIWRGFHPGEWGCGPQGLQAYQHGGPHGGVCVGLPGHTAAASSHRPTEIRGFRFPQRCSRVWTPKEKLQGVSGLLPGNCKLLSTRRGQQNPSSGLWPSGAVVALG